MTARDSLLIALTAENALSATAAKRLVDEHAAAICDTFLAELAAVRAERDEAQENLTGAYLARWEEEQDNDRLRLALESAKRGRKALRAELATSNAYLDATARLAGRQENRIRRLSLEEQAARETDPARRAAWRMLGKLPHLGDEGATS